MKIIQNNILPPKNFTAINLFGLIFVKTNTILSGRTVRHELIHTVQMKEMLYILFYIWYAIEWIIRFIQYKDATLAYYNISFEIEAYDNQNDIGYLETRKLFSWIKYL